MLILLGCIIALALILIWWYRILLILWCSIILLWATRMLNKILPNRLSHWLNNGPVCALLLLQLHYAAKQAKGIGAHCFEEDDE
jgi:hypothetical protein